MSSIARPKPRRETLPLERLIFDPAFQIRGELFNEAHVSRLCEIHEDGERFDPLEVVEVSRDGKGKLAPLYVVDGFNRGEMYRRRGVSGVECLVFTGTRADAELWALSSNSKQPLARAPEDCRRAFDRLISNPILLDRVIQHGKGKGGTERAIAQACGLSHGVVGKYIELSLLRVDRITGRLIPEDAESPEVIARRELAKELGQQGMTKTAIAKELGIGVPTLYAATRTTTKTESEGKGTRGKKSKKADTRQIELTAPVDPIQAGIEQSLTDSKAALRALGREVESLLRSRVGDALRFALKANGYPLVVSEREELAPMGVNEPPKMVKVETWPVVTAITAAVNDVQARLYSVDELER